MEGSLEKLKKASEQAKEDRLATHEDIEGPDPDAFDADTAIQMTILEHAKVATGQLGEIIKAKTIEDAQLDAIVETAAQNAAAEVSTLKDEMDMVRERVREALMRDLDATKDRLAAKVIQLQMNPDEAKKANLTPEKVSGAISRIEDAIKKLKTSGGSAEIQAVA